MEINELVLLDILAPRRRRRREAPSTVRETLDPGFSRRPFPLPGSSALPSSRRRGRSRAELLGLVAGLAWLLAAVLA